LSIERSKKRTVLILLFVVVLILIIMLFINKKTARESSFITEGRKKLAITGEVAAASNSSSLIYCVKDLLVEAEEENIRVKNIKGNIVWSQKLQCKITGLVDTGQSIVIIDSCNNISYYSLQGKLLWTYKSGYDIIDFFTEDNGSILLEYKGMTGSLAEIFAEDGSKVGNISVENAHVLSFSAGDGAFSISIIDTSSEVIKTKIITYNLKGDILWAHNFDGIIISKLKYSKDNRLIAIGENRAYIYKSDGSLQEEVEIEGEITNIAMDGYIITIALNNKGKQYAICYDSNLREQSRVEIKAAPSGIFPRRNNFIIYYNDEFLLLTNKGELTAKFKSNIDIGKVYMTPDNKVYVVSNRRLQMLEYSK